MPVRRRLVGLLVVLRDGRSIVRSLGRGGAIPGGRRSPVTPSRGAGAVALLVGGRAPASVAVPFVVSNHHFDITLSTVRGVTYTGKSDAARRGVGSRIGVRGDLDAAARAILQLLDCRSALADDEANLSRREGRCRRGEAVEGGGMV